MRMAEAGGASYGGCEELTIKFIHISVSMFEDEKIRLIEAMPEGEAIILLWMKLLLLAGRINRDGLIALDENRPYTDEMLATLFHKPLNTVRLALQTLAQFGMIQFTDEGIIITNWEKHQNVDGLARMRELTRKRVEKFRTKSKQLALPAPTLEQSNVTLVDSNVTVTQQNKNKNKKEKEIYKEKELLQLSPEQQELFDILLQCSHVQKEDMHKLIELLEDFPNRDYRLEFRTFIEWWQKGKRKAPWATLRNWMRKAPVVLPVKETVPLHDYRRQY